MTASRESWRERMLSELWEGVVPFWKTHSLDRAHGGYYNCLDHDGSCYDTTKHVWLQARQVWMFSKLAIESNSTELREDARCGAEFLAKHAVDSADRAYFSLRRDGKPVWLQRKIFSECFLVMAFAEFARASEEPWFRHRALELFERVLSLVEDPTLLDRPVLSGAPKAIDLAVPMIVLNVIAELRGEPGSDTYDDRPDYDELERHHAEQILLHHDTARGLVRERVLADGSVIDSSDGRLVNPGHVIEAAWFLIRYAERAGDAELVERSIGIMREAIEAGWDDEHGGLFYFIDAEGYSPTPLEWPMKLWWPHCEAIVGTLVAWRASGDDEWFERFEEIATWTFEHFPDAEHGEWFGYLDRAANVTHRFKGGPYKGCFHVPRALWMAERLLRDPVA